MSWTLDILEADQVVRLKTTGSHTPEDLGRMTVEALQVGARHGFERYLVDDRQMVPNLSTLEIYDLPKKLMDLGLTRRTRVAIIIAGDSPKRDDFSFWADRLITSGLLNIRLFIDSQENALAWLCGR